MPSRGITKIEILIVALIVLIFIIGNVVVIYHLNAKAYDIQVLSEVKQIKNGLEVFLLANNFYPEAKEPMALNDVYSGTEKLCLSGFKKLADFCEKNILMPIPNQYLAQGNRYYYKSIDDNKNYQIEFVLKTNFKRQGLLKGANCATNAGVASHPCF